MPAMSRRGERRTCVTASRTLAQTARQISSLDCSAIVAGLDEQSAMSRLAEASMVPCVEHACPGAAGADVDAEKWDMGNLG